MGAVASSSDHFALPQAHGREVLTASRATELLPPASARHFTRLTLSGHSFTLPAAEVFAPVIAALPSLTDVDLSDILAKRGTEEAIAVLDALCGAVSGLELRALNVSDNAIGARGVESVCLALRTQRRLQRVAFNNDGLQGQSVEVLVRALLQPFRRGATDDEGHHPTSLRAVEFYRNLLHDDGPHALVPLVLASPHLSHFVLSSSRVSSAGGLAITRALTSLAHLQALNLSDSNLGPDAGLVLARELLVPAKTQQLSVLHLGDIGVNDRKETGEAIRAIIAALRSSAPLLRSLDLQSNDLGPREARLLAASLRSKRHLTHLNVEANRVRSAGAIALAAAFSPATHPFLAHLNLSDNGLHSRAVPALTSLITAYGRTLTALHLNGNAFSDAALQELREAVEEAGGQAGEVLTSLSDNDEDEDDEEEEGEEEEEGAEGAEADEVAGVVAEAEAAENGGGTAEQPDKAVDQLADQLAQTRV